MDGTWLIPSANTPQRSHAIYMLLFPSLSFSLSLSQILFTSSSSIIPPPKRPSEAGSVCDTVISTRPPVFARLVFLCERQHLGLQNVPDCSGVAVPCQSSVTGTQAPWAGETASCGEKRCLMKRNRIKGLDILCVCVLSL